MTHVSSVRTQGDWLAEGLVPAPALSYKTGSPLREAAHSLLAHGSTVAAALATHVPEENHLKTSVLSQSKG